MTQGGLDGIAADLEEKSYFIKPIFDLQTPTCFVLSYNSTWYTSNCLSFENPQSSLTNCLYLLSCLPPSRPVNILDTGRAEYATLSEAGIFSFSLLEIGLILAITFESQVNNSVKTSIAIQFLYCWRTCKDSIHPFFFSIKYDNHGIPVDLMVTSLSES